MVLKLFSNHNLTISFPPFLCRIHSCVSEEVGRNKERHAHMRTHRDRGGEEEGGEERSRERDRASRLVCMLTDAPMASSICRSQRTTLIKWVLSCQF